MKIESLYRYPVKGLTPEPLASAALTAGRCLPWDRAFALAQGDATLDPANPAWVAKTNFMCLLRNAQIALLQTRFDDSTGLLGITTPSGEVFCTTPLTPEGQTALTNFLIHFLGPEARYGADNQPPAFRHFPDHSFCDHKTQVVSLIGLGSLGALETAVGAPRDKRRFRANIYIGNIAPWAEFDWLGKTLAIGDTRMVVQDRIDRCAATTVNPDTAIRDANPVKELQQNFGHVDLGIFAEVLSGGEIKPGDEIRVI
ncbi:MAG TPA: MOSC N-terminal beta barrel domain-containing protein [Acidocella sp.]|nr:MOSC N-terminal beta barrel domain-containing protein [Acidocella sp.]